MGFLKPAKANVYITGAGPGDPGLITQKAKEILQISEIIVYDNLVSSEILELALELNPETKLIYAGRVGYDLEKSVDQSSVNALLLKLAQDYKVICRLKGGDPSVFGRFGEEIVFLKENNIAFEVIPGVSSITAVPSYAGIPLTHRDCASSFTVLAAQRDPDDPENHIRWENFDYINGTLVILMGVKQLPKITDKLISLGRDKNTPLAIIYSGTNSNQKTYVSKLGLIKEDLVKWDIKTPSLIVIGDVVKYNGILNWFETKTLFGKKVLVTRSKDQAYSFATRLRKAGAKPILCPLVSYAINEKEIYNKNIINNIGSYNWIFFTSQNAVKYFFDILKRNCFDSRALGRVKVAAVGYKTKCELTKYNINPDFVPKRFSFYSLVKELQELENLESKKILYPSQKDSLREYSSLSITHWPIYKANFRNDLDVEMQNILSRGVDIVTFFSPNNAKQFSDIAKKYSLNLDNSIFAAIGDETAKVVLDIYGRVDIVANPSTEEGLITSIENYFSRIKVKAVK